jgi:hypothetical protein
MLPDQNQEPGGHQLSFFSGKIVLGATRATHSYLLLERMAGWLLPKC